MISEDESLLELINEKRVSKGQKPLEPAEDKIVTKTKKVSKTDPDSGYMHRDRKPIGFYHLLHGTVDSANNILLGLKVTPVIGPRKYAGKKHKKSKYWFDYYPEEDVYKCFENQILNYKTTTREGYVEYRSSKENCKNCPSREKCLYEDKKTMQINEDQTRTIRRHIKEHYADEVRAFMKTEKGKKLYARRKETIERIFADMKELCGIRYAHYRGNEGVKAQALLTGAALNIKKIAMIFSR